MKHLEFSTQEQGRKITRDQFEEAIKDIAGKEYVAIKAANMVIDDKIRVVSKILVMNPDYFQSKKESVHHLQITMKNLSEFGLNNFL